MPGKHRLFALMLAFLLLCTSGAVQMTTADAESAPDSSTSRPVNPITTTITLADDAIVIEGDGASAQGSTLTITQEGVYALSGTLKRGQIVIDAPNKADVELVLCGVEITASENAAIYCKNADHLIITLMDGTQNVLTDAKKYSYADEEKEEPNAALFSKCDLNMGGTGYLTVNASFHHGINTKDDLVIEGGGYIVKAEMDAIRGKDSVTVKNGSFDLTAGGDAIQASENENAEKGWVCLENGTYVIHASDDAVQAETDLTVQGGSFDITVEGKAANSTGSQIGFKANGNLTVNGGDFKMTTKDDAFHANLDVSINGGVYYIETKDDGFHADRMLYINDGEITIATCREGFEGTNIEVNGGKSFIRATNDAVSAAARTVEAIMGEGNRNGNPYVIATFNGGELEAISGGDTVDSNGHIYVNGGKLRLSSPPQPSYEGALLCNGDVYLYGGEVALVGNMGVNVRCKEQPVMWVSFTDTQKEGAVVTLRDQEGNILLSVTAGRDFKQSAFTSPQLQAGSTYSVYVNDEKKAELTLKNGMNTTGEDGGRFAGGYARGSW